MLYVKCGSTRHERYLRSLFYRSAPVIITAMILLAPACRWGDQGGGASTESSGSSSSEFYNSWRDFEGVIEMNGDLGVRPISMIYYIKMSKMRIEDRILNPPGEGVLLWDYSTGKGTALMAPTRTYTIIDFMGMQAEYRKNYNIKEYKFPKLADTGKKETIAGHTCEHYKVTDEQKDYYSGLPVEVNMDMCVAKGLGYLGVGGAEGSMGMPYLAGTEDISNASPEWKSLLEGGAFPLKMSTTRDGQKPYSLEVTKIERKSVDASLFAIPPGYKEAKSPTAP